MQSLERPTNPLFALIVSRPKSILGGFLLMTLLLGWQVQYFRIDASPDTLLTKDNKNYIQTELVNRRFAPEEFLLIAYQPHGKPLFSNKTIKDIKAISNDLKKLQRVASVRSILNVPIFSQSNGLVSSDTAFSEMTFEHKNIDLEMLRKEFTHHPIYENLLVNEQQTATAIQVLFKSNKKLTKLENRIIDLQKASLERELSKVEEDELERLNTEADIINQQLDRTRADEIATIRHIVENYQKDADIYLGGVHVLGNQLIQIIHNDLKVFGATIVIVICLILLLLFRKLRWVVIPVICCACSLLLTLGIFGMLGLKTTVISSNFIALQLILTLALVIHLIVQYRDNVAEQADLGQVELVKQTLEQKAGACFYAGFTAAIGFGSLIFCDIKPVITFGWMMIIAMFFSTVVSLILFPSILVLFEKDHVQQKKKLAHSVLQLCTYVTLKYSAFIALFCVCLIVMGIIGLTRLKVENSFINYFKSTTQTYRELSFIDKHFGGTIPLDLVYKIKDGKKPADIIMTADTVQHLQLIQHQLKQYPAIGRILSVVNFTDLARSMNDGKPLTEYELTSIYWLMEKSLRDDLLGSFLSPSNNKEPDQVRFAMWIKDSTEGLNREELIRDIKQGLNALDVPQGQYLLTNMFVLYQDILQRLFQSQILTVSIVYVVLLPTILVIFRSLRVALIAIVPNLLSTLVLLGAMGCLGIPLDLMTITIAAIAMGMGVDDTIHYIHRYLEELNNGDEKMAVEQCHSSVGFAMLYTTLSIMTGFSLLSFSDFVPSILFGLLTCFALFMALLFNLCVLPVLLMRFVHHPSARSKIYQLQAQ